MHASALVLFSFVGSFALAWARSATTGTPIQGSTQRSTATTNVMTTAPHVPVRNVTNAVTSATTPNSLPTQPTNQVVGIQVKKPVDCTDVLYTGYNTSGIYTIYPVGVVRGIDVYCDQDTDGGGWTVFQRRMDGSEDFFRNWDEYAFGFGDKNGEFWLGNEIVHMMTVVQGRKNEMRIELESFEREKRYANYRLFYIENAAAKYALVISGYSGTAGDALSVHNFFPFATKDRDQSGRRACTATYNSGWWFNKHPVSTENCLTVNLNGLYLHGLHTSFKTGINWNTWKGVHYSYMRSEMKIRPW